MFKSIVQTLLLSMFALVLSNTVHAEDLKSPYYQIKSFSMTEVPVDQTTLMTIRANYRQDIKKRDDVTGVGDILNPVKEVDQTLDLIINMGAKVWKIFEASTPVVNLNTKRANALPREARDGDWTDMAEWSDVQAKQYSIVYKNGFNAEVVRFSVLMTYSYNGTYKGKGRYLSDVGFLINEYWVAPLYSLNGESEVVRTMNVGRADAPIAGMELNMVWRVSNVLFKSQNAVNYFVRGDGGLTVREVKN
jgi:hypothetical protein